ncbi:hypothetical protein BJ508DRAFT_329161 [Ascobolus immersus RN42]|uniref:CCHC-type domain-containing protein n=1 Tax=Ascobolus immersus RN42 TaxID=1160509 RepID=A0A3N4HXW6_ASCIM|nr:hypothetical protein BJ508DRAFT_329161 [Ascobolus immersus RN42]
MTTTNTSDSLAPFAVSTNRDTFHTTYGSGLKLQSTNYHAWASAMLYILSGANAREIVTGEEAPPPAANTGAVKTYRQRSQQAVNLIYQACGDTERSHIEGIFDPIAMWTRLATIYDALATDDYSRAAVEHQFNNARMGTQFSCTRDYLAHLRTFQRQLAGSPNAIDDAKVIRHLFRTLPPKYRYILTHLRQLPVAEATVDNIEQRLPDEELFIQSGADAVGLDPATSATFANATALSAATANAAFPSFGHHGAHQPQSVVQDQGPRNSADFRDGYRQGMQAQADRARNVNQHAPQQHQQNARGQRQYTGARDYSTMRCHYCNQLGHGRSDCRLRMDTERLNAHRKQTHHSTTFRPSHRSGHWDKQPTQQLGGNANRHHVASRRNFGGHAAVAQAEEDMDPTEIFRDVDCMMAQADQFIDSNDRTLVFIIRSHPPHLLNRQPFYRSHRKQTKYPPGS